MSDEWAAKIKVQEVGEDGKIYTKTVTRSTKDFQFEKTLGRGSYSTVKLAKDIHSCEVYAIKVLDKMYIVKQKKVKYVTIEKVAMAKLRNVKHGIIRLFYTFQDEFSLYFVLNYATNGDLLTLINKYGSLNQETVLYYGAQILDALHSIHSCGILHRDVKPENILLDSQFHVQVADFGTAKIKTEQDSQKTEKSDSSSSFVGTAEYVSPELLFERNVDVPCDIWSYGCILYQMIAGKPPFKAANDYLIFQLVKNCNYVFTPGFPAVLKDLVKKILVVDPSNRYTYEQITGHEFFQKVDFSDSENSVWYTPHPEFSSFKFGSRQVSASVSASASASVTATAAAPAPAMATSLNAYTSNKTQSLAAAAALATVSAANIEPVNPKQRKESASSTATLGANADAPIKQRGSDMRMKYHDAVDPPKKPKAKPKARTLKFWASSQKQ